MSEATWVWVIAQVGLLVLLGAAVLQGHAAKTGAAQHDAKPEVRSTAADATLATGSLLSCEKT